MSGENIELPNGGMDPGAEADPAPEPETSSGSIFDRLLSTHKPDRNPPDLEREYEIPKGIALMLYGALQMAETGGMPAIGNMLLGAWIEIQNREFDANGDGDTADNEPGEYEITELDPE